jgi:hypothetical protein
MNTFSRLCMVVLFAAWLPAAWAQDAPPKEEPKATQREEMKKEIDEAVDAIRDYSLERRNEAVVRARQSADDIDRRMGQLQAQMEQRWDRMSEAARTRSQQEIADLRQRRNELSEWTGGMRHSSAEAWDEVKTGFIESYNNLAEALRKARTEFEREEEPRPQVDDDSSADKLQDQEH